MSMGRAADWSICAAVNLRPTNHDCRCVLTPPRPHGVHSLGRTWLPVRGDLGQGWFIATSAYAEIGQVSNCDDTAG